MARQLTPEQLSFLETCPENLSREQIAEIFGIPRDDLPEIKPKKKHHKKGPRHIWEPEQEQFLLENYNNFTLSELSELLGVRKRLIYDKWKKLTKGTDLQNQRQAEKEKRQKKIADFIQTHIDSMTYKQMAEAIGEPERTLYTIAKKYGFRRPEPGNEKSIPYENILSFIKEHFQEMTYAQMAEATGYGKNSLQRIASRNGLCKTERASIPDSQKDALLVFLKEHIDKMTWQEMETATGVSASMLQHLARKSNIRKTPTSDIYKGVDKTQYIPFIQENIDRMTWAQMSKATGLSRDQVITLARNNGIAANKNKNAAPLTDEQKHQALLFLQEHLNDMTWPELVQATGHTKYQLECLARENGLKKARPEHMPPIAPNEEAQIAGFLKEHCCNMTWNELIAQTGHTKKQLLSVMSKYGIEKPDIRQLRLQKETELVAYLKKNVNCLTWKEMAEATGYNLENLRAFAERRGIKKNGVAVIHKQK